MKYFFRSSVFFEDDFSCFPDQNSAHILEEFGIRLLFLSEKLKCKNPHFELNRESAKSSYLVNNDLEPT